VGIDGKSTQDMINNAQKAVDEIANFRKAAYEA
jgi:hypothetical protein